MTYKGHTLREGNRDGNWIRYWEEATNKPAFSCHKVGCIATATDGAHVQLSDSSDHKWYVVPLCHTCNCQFGQEFFFTGPLVSVTNPNDILW